MSPGGRKLVEEKIHSVIQSTFVICPNIRSRSREKHRRYVESAQRPKGTFSAGFFLAGRRFLLDSSVKLKPLQICLDKNFLIENCNSESLLQMKNVTLSIITAQILLLWPLDIMTLITVASVVFIANENLHYFSNQISGLLQKWVQYG